MKYKKLIPTPSEMYEEMNTLLKYKTAHASTKAVPLPSGANHTMLSVKLHHQPGNALLFEGIINTSPFGGITTTRRYYQTEVGAPRPMRISRHNFYGKLLNL